MIKDAIQTILQDREIKEAILEYLKSVTIEPQQQWREIYRSQSEIRTRLVEYDPITGVNNSKREFRLFMRVYYNDAGRIGKVIFLEDGAYLFDRHSEYRYFDNSVMQTEDATLISEPDVFKVIDRALELWPARKAEFESLEMVAAL